MNITRRDLLQSAAGLAAAGGWTLSDVLPAAAQSFVMKLTTSASNDLDTEWLDILKKEVESASAGKIKANIYPASQLGSAPTTIEGVATGTIEVGINASGFYEGLNSRFAALSVPGILKSMAQGAKVMADPDVQKQYGVIGTDKGYEVLTAMAHSPAAIVSKKPINTIGDFAGMKIRVPGSAILIEQLKKVGASPVAMTLGEVLPSLQNGTIDGAYAGNTIFTALKYYDVAKNMTLLPDSFIVIVGIVNRKFMKSLGSMEELVRNAARKADVGGAAEAEADVKKGMNGWQANGGKVIEFSAADAKSYLDLVVPASLAKLNAEGRQDYDILKSVSTKYT
jgi:TRAP-type C4-dicarboxylate transport system substrate-binding protein